MVSLEANIGDIVARMQALPALLMRAVATCHLLSFYSNTSSFVGSDPTKGFIYKRL